MHTLHYKYTHYATNMRSITCTNVPAGERPVLGWRRQNALYVGPEGSQKATASHVISDWAVNSIDCNRFSQHLLATGSGSKGRGVVRVWDDRKMDAPLNELTLHSDVVDVVSWSTHTEHVLASGSRDRKVQLVDIQKALPYSPSAAAMGDHDAREVMFVHAGHRHNVSDIAWNHECPWLVSSVSDAEENIQVSVSVSLSINERKGKT